MPHSCSVCKVSLAIEEEDDQNAFVLATAIEEHYKSEHSDILFLIRRTKPWFEDHPRARGT